MNNGKKKKKKKKEEKIVYIWVNLFRKDIKRHHFANWYI